MAAGVEKTQQLIEAKGFDAAFKAHRSAPNVLPKIALWATHVERKISSSKELTQPNPLLWSLLPRSESLRYEPFARQDLWTFSTHTST